MIKSIFQSLLFSDVNLITYPTNVPNCNILIINNCIDTRSLK